MACLKTSSMPVPTTATAVRTGTPRSSSSREVSISIPLRCASSIMLRHVTMGTRISTSCRVNSSERESIDASTTLMSASTAPESRKSRATFSARSCDEIE